MMILRKALVSFVSLCNLPHFTCSFLHNTHLSKSANVMTPKTFISSSSSLDTTTDTTLNHIDGINQLTNSYSTFLLDMWGVMHDGTHTYEGVKENIQNLRQNGKKIIILSNSSKTLDNAVRTLTKLGFDPSKDFDQIITSGDVSHRMLSGDKTLKCSTWNILDNLIQQNKKNVFVLGSGDNDEEYCTSCGWNLSSIDDADLIIARGTFTINDGSGNIISKNDDEEAYFKALEDVLDKASKRQVPMLVTNPDKVRPDKDLPPMPGAIGDAYEKNLSSAGLDNSLVKRIGKPYPEVYELAMNDCDDTSSVIMVGDALETDISGGKWSNIDSVWVVNDGIHSARVEELMKDDNVSFEDSLNVVLKDFSDMKGYKGDDRLCPTFAAKHFRW